MKTSLFAMLFSVVAGGALYAQGDSVSDDFVREQLTKGKPYTLVFLKASTPKEAVDETKAAQIQADHLKYLFTLNQRGDLAVFGPLADGGELRGICIFNTADAGLVKKWLDDDPHIKSGSLTYEIRPWFSIPGQKLQ